MAEAQLHARGLTFMDEDLIELATSVVLLTRIVEGLIEDGPPPAADQRETVVGMLGAMRDRAQRIRTRRA
jgi:hypothetical protein